MIREKRFTYFETKITKWYTPAVCISPSEKQNRITIPVESRLTLVK